MAKKPIRLESAAPPSDQESKKKKEYKTVALNRKAKFEYFLEEFFEAGLSLVGSEVKSLRAGNASIQDAFARPEGDELWLHGMHINPWDTGSHFQPEAKRKRRLLLHVAEIRRLIGKVNERGYSLIPTRVYFKGRWAKVEIALAKGKKLFDKRQSIREKEAQREVDRAFRGKEY